MHAWNEAPHPDGAAARHPDGLRLEDKKEIYFILSASIQPESELPLAAAGRLLMAAERPQSYYGFSKLRALFDRLGEFLTVYDEPRAGGLHTYVILHSMPAWDAERGGALKASWPEEGAKKPDLIPEQLEGHVYLPAKTLQKLNLALTGREAAPSQQIVSILTTGYERARASDEVRRRGESYMFPLYQDTPKGIPVCASFKPSDFIGGFPWYLNYAGPSQYQGDQPRYREEESCPPGRQAASGRRTDGRLSQTDQREIYRALTAVLPLEEKLHMATVSLKLHETGHAKEQYGYTRMKSMLQDMRRFVGMEDVVMNGVPQVLVTLHAVPQWDDMPDKADKARQDVPDKALPPRFADLPPCMEGHVYLPPKTLQKLNLALTGSEEPPDASVVNILTRSYERAKEADAFYFKNDAYTFDVDLTDQEGNPIGGAIKRSDFSGGLPWYLNYAGPNRYAISKAPGKMLEQFAFLGSWPSFLEELARKALPEPWDFGDGGKSYSILKKYIQYTFYRLHLEDKICISEDKTFAAFNTGLVTPHYDDLYACFEASEGEEHATGWRFLEFSTAAVRGMGKRLVDAFNPLPEPPSYFARKEDLLFDLEKELHTDYDHILLDNIARLPLEFLEEECRGVGEAVVLVDRIRETGDWYERKQLYRELSDYIAGTTRLYNRLRNRLEDAIKLARKKVRWNFKTAIPCYFPTRNVMSLMLPLALLEDTRADVALVVELTRSGNYQGQTILTLQQAYLDGRLLCRPNSEWLDTRDISGEDDGDPTDAES